MRYKLSQIESSIIIPVFNKWNLTKQCLEALAATVADEAVEILIIDNASGDATPQHCPKLGQKLFGERFRYLRQAHNINFGPASNLGAEQSQGEFLIFLNNDTQVLPGWYRPLIDDFTTFSDIAGTGPLLLYPPSEFFGSTVQHLGVCFSFNLHTQHYHRNIGVNSPLVKRRRFFQVITAACLVMRKKLFMEAGQFYPGYINGFEDVDLCARLSAQGYKFTVNPSSQVLHFESQSSGRFNNEEHNSRLVTERLTGLLHPDFFTLIQNDGLALTLDPWLNLKVVDEPKATEKTEFLVQLKQKSFTQALAFLDLHPYWEEGWRLLAARLEKEGQFQKTFVAFQRMLLTFLNPNIGLEQYKMLQRIKNIANFHPYLEILQNFLKPWQHYYQTAHKLLEKYLASGQTDAVALYQDWLAHAEEKKKEYLNFMADCWQILHHAPLQLDWESALQIAPQLDLPSPMPPVTLFLDCREAKVLQSIRTTLSILHAKTAYPALEVVLLREDTAPLSELVHKAQEGILGFLYGGLLVRTQNWLEEFVAVLYRAGVGAVGGKLHFMDGKLLHCGLQVNADGEFVKILPHLPEDDPTYHAWDDLPRTVDALDATCLFTHKKLLLEFGTVDLPNYCLFLQKCGLRTLWWPNVDFALRSTVSKQTP